MAGLVSVIIPVYNMETTVGKSIDSVLGQTLRTLELVVVDDGSTDSSGAICDAAAARDDRVRVIHKPNGGVSSARNAGLAAAKGDYIAWLDADDWMEPEALQALMDAIDRNGASMALCNYENVERSGKREKRYAAQQNEVITGREALERLIRRQITQSLCFNLSPRAFYEGVHFPDGRLFEDVRTSYRLYAQSEKVAVVNDHLLYNRLVRSESISHAKTIDMRAASCEAYLIRQEELEKLWPESEAIFVRSNYAMMLLLMRAAVLRDSAENFKKSRAIIRRVMSYFHARTRMALGEHPGIGRRLEYFFLTSGTRTGFFLSRVVTLPKKGGTWLEQ